MSAKKRSDVTIVIASLNVDRAKIKRFDISPYNIIVVSPEKHTEKIDGVKFIQDEGKGLARARNLAIPHIKTEWALITDFDTVIPHGTLEKLIEYTKEKHYTACGLLTRCLDTKTYDEKCLDIRWRWRFKAGERKSIGSPYLISTWALRTFGFDDACGYCDDTDIFKRITDGGHLIAYSPYECYEIPGPVKTRFLMYGKSDAQYYAKYSKGWSFLRKIWSILHPLVCEFIPNIFYLPFYAKVVYYRYRGWYDNRSKC